MNSVSAKQAGHTPTLVASFLHFDVSFMLWVLLGALGIYIAESLHLSPAQKGFMVAVPILSGSLLRIPLGLLSDRIGGKRIGVAMLGFLFLPLTLGWLWGGGLSAMVAVGLMLGTAGASFAVALPLASRWYPAERQGLVMGIAAAGNSGTVIANLAAPRIANIVGWHNAVGLAMVPLAAVLIAFLFLAKDAQRPAQAPTAASYLSILRRGDLWWLCLFYSITFGGYVGLSSFLPIFLRDQYGVSPITAGYLTAIAAFSGSCVRPLGGYLADRFGGPRVLAILLTAIPVTYFLVGQLPALGIMMVLLVGGMACLGMGNGAVFQIVPQRFRNQIGITTGLVGAVGGLGGFLLPIILGDVKQSAGSYGTGFLVLSLLGMASLVLLRSLMALRLGWSLPRVHKTFTER